MKQFVYVEENGHYKIVVPDRVSCVQLDRIYEGSQLKSVDIILVTGKALVFMEYKNSTIPGAANPEAFDEKLSSDKHSTDIARKYYDSLLYPLSTRLTDKPLYYHYVVEASTLDSALRKMLAEKIVRKLPFQLQKRLKVKLISDFSVDSIDDWNVRYPDLAFQQIVKNPQDAIDLRKS